MHKSMLWIGVYYKYKWYERQAGAEVCQAQVKFSLLFEVQIYENWGLPYSTNYGCLPFSSNCFWLSINNVRKHAFLWNVVLILFWVAGLD